MKFDFTLNNPPLLEEIREQLKEEATVIDEYDYINDAGDIKGQMIIRDDEKYIKHPSVDGPI